MRRLLLLGLIAATPALHAGPQAPPATGIGVAPIRLDLAAGEKAAVLDVSNASTERVEMQARAMAWSQPNGEDAHVPTDDVIVSPPRFTLEANGEQTLRVYLRAPNVGTERTYRIFLDQLPDAQTPMEQPTVQFPLRLMVPMFVAGAAGELPALTWTARLDGDRVSVRVSNAGARHVRLAHLALRASAADGADDAPMLVYVLPGATRTIEFPRPSWLTEATHTLFIDGDGDAGAFEVRVDVAR